MSIVEKILQAVEDTMVEAEVDFPAGREAGPRIQYDSDGLRQEIEAVLSLATKEAFSGTVDTDTPLMAAAREAGWALMELVDGVDWEKRDQVSDIIGQLGAALTASDADPVCTVAQAGSGGNRWASVYPINALDHLPVGTPLYTAPPAPAVPVGWKFKLGDRAHKPRGSWWEGRIVGWYSTEQTPRGYCVQIDKPNGPVQIYPEAALAAAPEASHA